MADCIARFRPEQIAHRSNKAPKMMFSVPIVRGVEALVAVIEQTLRHLLIVRFVPHRSTCVRDALLNVGLDQEFGLERNHRLEWALGGDDLNIRDGRLGRRR